MVSQQRDFFGDHTVSLDYIVVSAAATVGMITRRAVWSFLIFWNATQWRDADFSLISHVFLCPVSAAAGAGPAHHTLHQSWLDALWGMQNCDDCIIHWVETCVSAEHWYDP